LSERSEMKRVAARPPRSLSERSETKRVALPRNAPTGR
jgi:hypothetical protein